MRQFLSSQSFFNQKFLCQRRLQKRKEKKNHWLFSKQLFYHLGFPLCLSQHNKTHNFLSVIFNICGSLNLLFFNISKDSGWSTCLVIHRSWVWLPRGVELSSISNVLEQCFAHYTFFPGSHHLIGSLIWVHKNLVPNVVELLRLRKPTIFQLVDCIIKLQRRNFDVVQDLCRCLWMLYT